MQQKILTNKVKYSIIRAEGILLSASFYATPVVKYLKGIYMNRLTYRKEEKVFTKGISKNCGKPFCAHAVDCTYIRTRDCPHLKLLDTLADIEDACEECGIVSLEHLVDTLTYCKSVGIINKILKMYTEEEE